MSTFTFTLRGGITLADAGFMYGGSRYDVDDALAAGSGTITTTDSGLAEQLRQMQAPDGLPLLNEGGVTPGAAADPLLSARRNVYVRTSATEAPGMSVCDLVFVKDAGTGKITDVLEKTA